MATISLKLDTRRKNKNGEYPICYCISHKSVTCTIPSGINIKESELYGSPQRMVRSIISNSEKINEDLYKLLLTYQNKLAFLEQEGKVDKMTAAEIKHYLITAEEKQKDKLSFTEYASTYIERYNGRTKSLYCYTLKLVSNFFKGNVVFFDDITAGTLHAMDDEWSKTMGLSARSIQFRNIRTIFNRAIDDEVTIKYPFRTFKIKDGRKEKKYLPIDVFTRLRNLTFPENTTSQELARDLFLLSFYLCGVNINDMFVWDASVLKNGKITFVRKKVAHHEPDEITLTVQPEAMAIIQKYKGNERLLNLAEQYNNSYSNFYGYMTHKIRKVGTSIDFPELTMYYARYSWATYADQLGIDEKVISKSLGHTDQSVAGRHYISYDWSRTDEANRKVIDYALNGSK